MRKITFVGCWKSNKTIKEVGEYMKSFANLATQFKSTVDVVLCPAACYFDRVNLKLPINVKLGAQNVSIKTGSATETGAINAATLKQFAITHCVVGHSDQRAIGETNEQINKKIKQLQENRIVPIICFGESRSEYDAGLSMDAIRKQLDICFDGVSDFEHIILCYQPVWALGTGLFATYEWCEQVSEFCRKHLATMSRNPLASQITLIYGGGVSPQNVKGYLEVPNIDGVFVAGASLNPADFAQVINTEFKKHLPEVKAE
ncbi:MAG: triose-phosphate isomerase [Christensenellaceae bacterium]|jgi:triosephosphate isomerase|nr:triose-phosphate isomerase [Christensenellaceae bacterium]